MKYVRLYADVGERTRDACGQPGACIADACFQLKPVFPAVFHKKLPGIGAAVTSLSKKVYIGRLCINPCEYRGTLLEDFIICTLPDAVQWYAVVKRLDRETTKCSKLHKLLRYTADRPDLQFCTSLCI